MPVIESPAALSLERVMVATDFTPSSEAAMRYAAMLAKHFSSELMVVHGVDLSVATRNEEAVVGLPVDEMRQTSATHMERALGELSGPGLRTQGHTFEAHNVAAGIVGLSKEIKTDLLVVGTHARHGLNKLILGSVSEGIIRHAECPVLVIGPKVKVPEGSSLSIQNIVFATDLRHDALKKAKIAFALGREAVGKIYLCHVIDREGKDITDAIEQEFEVEERLQDLVPSSAYDWCSPECVVKHGSAGEEIVALARKVNADLIVLGAKRSASWFAHLSEGAVGKVISEAECPILTICND